MRYLAIALLLSGCATTQDVDSLKLQLTVTRHRLDETRYHVQIESCRTTALVCGIVTKNEEKCINDFAQCVTSALDEFRTQYGKDPSDLFDPKRAR